MIEKEERYFTLDFESFYCDESTKEKIFKLISQGTLPQTILITGPSHVGKTTLAYILSASLNCERPTPFPCLNCYTCQKIAKGVYPDIRLITTQKEELRQKKEILVDQIREEILNVAELPPHEGKKLVFIIEKAELLNINSQNALLKILEEPPSYIQFFLVCKEKSKLLPTILSRCYELKLKELSLLEMKKLVKKLNIEIDQSVLSQIVRGRVGLLLSQKWEEKLNLRNHISKILPLLNRIMDNYCIFCELLDGLTEFEESEVLEETLSILRDILRGIKKGDKEIKLREDDVYQICDRIFQSFEMLNRNVNIKMVYHYIFLGSKK